MSAVGKVPFGHGIWLSVIAAHLWKYQAEKAAEELAARGKRQHGDLHVSEEHFLVDETGTLTISVTIVDLEHDVTLTVEPNHWGYYEETNHDG